MLHHIILIQMQVGIDKGHVPFNLAELITTSQKHQVILEFILAFLAFARENPRLAKATLFHEVVTDKSFANIGAISFGFNGMTITEYLNACFTILASENPRQEIGRLVVIRLCSSHTTKTMREDILKHFSDPSQAKIVCELIGVMFNISSFKQLEAYVKGFLIVLLSRHQGEVFERYAQESQEILTSNESSLEIDEDGEDVEGLADEEPKKTIYANSPFFKMFAKFISEVQLDIEGDENQFYCPSLAHIFLKHHLPYLPLWSHIMTAVRDPQQPRANNGPLENYNGKKKREAREAANFIGTFGQIKVGRFVAFTSQKIDELVKKISFNIPARTRINNKKRLRTGDNEITEHGVEQSIEQYKKRQSGPQKRQPSFFPSTSTGRFTKTFNSSAPTQQNSDSDSE